MRRRQGTHFVITASSTASGAAVYLRADRSWGSTLCQAHAVRSPDERDELLAFARTLERQVCDPYSLGVVLEPSGPRGLNQREAIRATGPTCPQRRPDPDTRHEAT